MPALFLPTLALFAFLINVPVKSPPVAAVVAGALLLPLAAGLGIGPSTAAGALLSAPAPAPTC